MTYEAFQFKQENDGSMPTNFGRDGIPAWLNQSVLAGRVLPYAASDYERTDHLLIVEDSGKRSMVDEGDWIVYNSDMNSLEVCSDEDIGTDHPSAKLRHDAPDRGLRMDKDELHEFTSDGETHEAKLVKIWEVDDAATQ